MVSCDSIVEKDIMKIEWYFVAMGDLLTSSKGSGSSVFRLADLSDSLCPVAL